MTRSAHEQPAGDDCWDEQERDETPTERLDRNWAELLQELRVVQTGVQILTGFLLTLPFQQRFATLDSGQHVLYLAAVASSVLATGLLQAPVSVHRALFQRHRRGRAVRIAHRLTIVGLGFLAAAVVCVVSLIFGVVAGTAAGWIAGAVALVVLTILWLVVPLVARTEPDDPQ